VQNFIFRLTASYTATGDTPYAAKEITLWPSKSYLWPGKGSSSSGFNSLLSDSKTMV